MTSPFPRVIVTLSPTLVSASEDEIVINPRAMIITRAGCRPETFNAGAHRAGRGRPGANQFTLCAALIARRGAVISTSEMADALWGEDEGGGPDAWYNTIHVTICMIKPKFARLGLRIVNRNNVGYFAEPLPAALSRAA